ncbi:MAG: TIGR04282 family arsenosugar biosynthesis glycosyltransferase [Thermoanaerobaculia bacterium]
MTPAALVLFGKIPVPGRVKTRLAKSIGPKHAAALSECFLRDTVRACTALAAAGIAGGIDPVLAADPAPHPFWDGLVSSPWRVEAQGEGDLGRRIARVFDREFVSRERVAVLGSDHPALPWSRLGAFLASSNAIWPTRDGGFAALILTRRGEIEPLFDGIEWSTPSVFEQTLDRAKKASIELEIFPETYDVDREEDLEVLARDLEGRDSATPDFPRETWRALRTFRSARPELA